MTSGGPLTSRLLDWYDRERRDLAWRAPPGVRPDPYHVWLSEVMLQQTTVKAVTPYFMKFTRVWPSVSTLAAAPREEVLAAWAGLGYYARARNLHACAVVVAEQFGGRFPETEAGLRTLPGIGEYTAAAIAAIAFDEPATVVDGNVERVVTRLRAINTPLPKAKKDVKVEVAALVPQARPGDFAQAMMDLGATVCTPKSPACMICPWRVDCAAHAAGEEIAYPVKTAKAAKPVRYGTIFVLVDGEDGVFVRTRPDKGLLGGMTEFPGSDWATERPDAPDWVEMVVDQRVAGTVTHVFTHFELRLSVVAGALHGTAPPDWRVVSGKGLMREALPSVMKKVASVAFGS